MHITPYAPFASVKDKDMPFYVSTVGNPKFQPKVNRPKGINDYMFLYTVKGCGLCSLDGKEYEMKAGTILYAPPATPHLYHPTDTEWETVYVTFNGSGIQGFLSEKASVCNISQACAFTDICSRIYTLKKDPQSYKETSKLLYGLIVDLRELMSEKPPHINGKKNVLSHIIHYISENPNVRLRDIAERFDISEEYFCRIFKKYTGYRLMEYLNILKIINAAKLLQETDNDIAKIADTVGYASHSYFTMQFKKHMGMTPGAYRETHTNPAAPKT